MNCVYCDRIREADPAYVSEEASHDLGSEAPRCSRHWRYLCAACGRPSSFISTAYCPQSRRFFCADCAVEVERVNGPFWHWRYYFRYRSPWDNEWQPALDKLEFQGEHPLSDPGTERLARDAISRETDLVRYPRRTRGMQPVAQLADADVRANWNRNADRWDAEYDDDGDRNRRYQSDEPMLELLGKVAGLTILDVGSGNGYLCRKLARQGARMEGVELSDRFVELARDREEQEQLGVVFHHGSASNMNHLPDQKFDKAVSNYVLMDIADYVASLHEVFRVLRPGGIYVVVISHPCFATKESEWIIHAYDSPRREDRDTFCVDRYFHKGPFLVQWGEFDPVLGFHRPLRDYWQAFMQVGFQVTGFDEPSITDRGRRELPPEKVEQSLRIPYSCIFRLQKPDTFMQ